MAISAELSDHLRQLALGLDLHPDFFHDALADLVVQVQRAVPSYCGLQVTLFDHGWPVTLTQVTGTGEVPAVTSLRVALHTLVVGHDQDSGHILFAATSPGAFLDLAADLSYALGVPFLTGEEAAATSEPTTQHRLKGSAASVPRRIGPAALAVDAGLLPPTAVSGLSGLDELSIIHQAVGRLIESGHLPEDAHDLIRTGADCAGVAAHLFAARLLPPSASDGTER